MHLRKAGAQPVPCLFPPLPPNGTVPPVQCRAENARLPHTHAAQTPLQPASRQRIRSPASRADPPLKPAAEFTLIGKPPSYRRSAKVSGQAKFGIDTRIPGMLVAFHRALPGLRRHPALLQRDQVKKLPASRRLEISAFTSLISRRHFGPGSRNYTCSGVAVVADSTWAALQARKATPSRMGETIPSRNPPLSPASK